MSIKDRIKNLEKYTAAGDNEPIWLVIVTGELNREATTEEVETYRKQADAKVKAARAEYRAAHPECSEMGINTIAVRNEKTKELIDRIGERLGNER